MRLLWPNHKTRMFWQQGIALRTVLALGLGAVGHEAAGKSPALDAALEALADGGARHVHQVTRLQQPKGAGVMDHIGGVHCAAVAEVLGRRSVTLQPSPLSNAGVGAWHTTPQMSAIAAPCVALPGFTPTTPSAYHTCTWHNI